MQPKVYEERVIEIPVGKKSNLKNKKDFKIKKEKCLWK
jgi:hypothetical protein